MDDEKLGIIFPAIPDIFILGDGFPYKGNGKTPKYTEMIFDKLKLRHKNDKYLFPAGTIFWYRPNALKRLLQYDIKKFDIPKEPIESDGTILHAIERSIAYIAFSEGYKYKIAIDKDILKETYLNYEQHIQYIKNNTLSIRLCIKLLIHAFKNKIKKKIPFILKIKAYIK